MGSGASSAAKAGISSTSAKELHEAFKSMSPEELARFSTLVDEASKEADSKPTPPTFEKPPMAVPGISKEFEEPSRRSLVSTSLPAGRPRSADGKKAASAPATTAKQEEAKANPAKAENDSKASDKDNEKPDAVKSTEDKEVKADTPKVEGDAKLKDKASDKASDNPNADKASEDKGEAVEKESKDDKIEVDAKTEEKDANTDSKIAVKAEKVEEESSTLAEHTEAVTEK